MVHLLRPVYSTWEMEWRLEEELNYTDDYIELMRLRSEEPILITRNIQNVDSDIRVPRFILQPLLENCFMHGVRSGCPFNIELSAEQTEQAVLLKVTDNGSGIPPDTLLAIRAALDAISRGETVDRFIGMCNVHRRLRLYLGENSGLDIESTVAEGTVITVRLASSETKV